jgi:hypothetical protein
MSRTAGIRTRHSRRCRSRAGGKCICDPSYEAWAWSKLDGKKIRRTFYDYSEAKGWRHDAAGAVRRGALRTAARRTIREAGDALIAGMRSGEVRTRKGGRKYKPSAIRGYEADLKNYVYDDLGACRLSDVRRRDVQALADKLVGQGLSGSKVRNVITALKVIYRRELEHDDLAVNPTTNLRLPEVDGTREWDATPEQGWHSCKRLTAGRRSTWRPCSLACAAANCAASAFQTFMAWTRTTENDGSALSAAGTTARASSTRSPRPAFAGHCYAKHSASSWPSTFGRPAVRATI